jgi:hypothetical protein
MLIKVKLKKKQETTFLYKKQLFNIATKLQEIVAI